VEQSSTLRQHHLPVAQQGLRLVPILKQLLVGGMVAQNQLEYGHNPHPSTTNSQVLVTPPHQRLQRQLQLVGAIAILERLSCKEIVIPPPLLQPLQIHTPSPFQKLHMMTGICHLRMNSIRCVNGSEELLEIT